MADATFWKNFPRLTMIGLGTLAERPVKAESRYHGYWAIDTETLYLSNVGLDWIAVGSGSILNMPPQYTVGYGTPGEIDVEWVDVLLPPGQVTGRFLANPLTPPDFEGPPEFREIAGADLWGADDLGIVDQLALTDGYFHTSSSSPTTANNMAQGYDASSIWQNTASKRLWIFHGETAGSAIWFPIGSLMSIGITLSGLSWITPTNSPRTTDGNITLTASTQAMDQVLGTPSGANGAVGLVSLNNTHLPTVSITKGGTGQTTKTPAFDALSPLTTEGDLVTHDGTNNIRLAKPAALQSIRRNAANILWEAYTPSISSLIAILRDEKTSGTHGGTSVAATWNARDINTELYDPDSIVTIASNQFTPIAGDYEILVFAPFRGGAAAQANGRIRLYNVTGAAAVEEGMSVVAATATFTVAVLQCKFTANGTNAYRIDTYTSVGNAGTGLGAATSDGSAEVYTMVHLRKVA